MLALSLNPASSSPMLPFAKTLSSDINPPGPCDTRSQCDTLVHRPSPHSSTMEGDCCVLGTHQEASRIVLYRRLSRATLALLAHLQPCLLLHLARRVAEELYRLDHSVGN